MERPDNITGALRYGTKRTVRKREEEAARRSGSLLSGPLDDWDTWKKLPERTGRRFVDIGIEQGIAGAVRGADEWINGDARIEKQLFTTSEKPANMLASQQSAVDYGNNLYNLVQRHNGSVEQALMQQHNPAWRDRYRQLLAQGKIKYEDKVLTANDLSDELIDTITYEERKAYANSLLPHAKEVLKARNSGSREDLEALFQIHNLRPGTGLGRRFDGKTTEELDAKAWANIEATDLYKNSRAFQNAVTASKGNLSLDYMNDALQKIKTSERLAAENFNVTKVTEAWEPHEDGSSKYVVRAFTTNRITGIAERVAESTVMTKKLSNREILESIPINTVIKNSGLNKKAQMEILGILSRKYKAKDGQPIVWSRLHEYSDEDGILKIRNNALRDIQAFREAAGDEQLYDTATQQKNKVINALIVDTTKEMQDAGASQSDTIKAVNSGTETMKRILDVNEGLKTYVPMNNNKSVEVQGVSYGQGDIYLGASVPVGFDVQRDENGTIKMDEAGGVTAVPLSSVPLRERALNLHIFNNNQRGRGTLSKYAQQDYLDNLTEEQLDAVRTKEEKEKIRIDTDNNRSDNNQNKDNNFIEVNNESDTVSNELDQIVEESSESRYSEEFLAKYPKIDPLKNPRLKEGVGHGKTLTEIRAKLKQGSIPMDSIKNILDIGQESSTQHLSKIRVLNRWYKDNYNKLAIAIAANEDLYDLFMAQGYEGLVKRFYPKENIQKKSSLLARS